MSTDNARAEARRRQPLQWRESVEWRDGFVAGAEWAAGRAETTTATTEDAVERVFQTTHPAPNTVMGWIRAGYEAGLLASSSPARTRPTREQIAKRLFATHATDHAAATAPEIYRLCEDAADAVLALLADQPTEAEAGARALEAAAHILGMMELNGMHLTDMDISGWLHERAARLRGGGDQ